MSVNVFSLSLVNLALDGSLDSFSDLYNITYHTYLQKVQEEPGCIRDRKKLNLIVIPELIAEFERVALKHLELFTSKCVEVRLYANCFRFFEFIDAKKIKDFDWKREWYREWKSLGYRVLPYQEPYLDGYTEEFELQETVVDLQQFVLLFKNVVSQAIYPLNSPFEVRKQVDAYISTRMQMKRDESVVPIDDVHSPTGAELFVFDSLNNTTCKIHHHRVIPKKYFAQHIDGERVVVLPTHYCQDCNRYMMGALSLSLFRRFCGKFIVQTVKLDLSGNSEWILQGESNLHRLGYSVVDGRFSAAERQSVLVSILENKRLPFFEVVATIEQNIRIFKNNYRMQRAVQKWQDDLRFINEYALKKGK